MHLQQPKCNEHGQVVGEGVGTTQEVQQDIPACLVRRTTVEATLMATGHTFTAVIPEHTRGQHKIHAGEFRRGQRTAHIQGLRDTEDAEKSRLLARKRRRKYAK